MLEDGLSRLFQSKTENSARTQGQPEREKQKKEKHERRRKSDPGPFRMKFLHRGSNQEEISAGKNRIPSEQTQWHTFCKEQEARKSRLRLDKTIRSKASHFFAYITSVLDLNDPAENKSSNPIPNEWFPRSENSEDAHKMPVKNASDTSILHDPAVDDRLPMIVIVGAPFSGKSIVARELGGILGEKVLSQLYSWFETVREAALSLFGGSSHQPTIDEPGACYNFGAPTGPKEIFADGRVVVCDVNHMSYLHHLRQMELESQVNGEGSSQARRFDADREAQLANFCASLATVKNEKLGDDAQARLDSGRRMALQEGLLDHKEPNSTVIFTEYLPKSDDYKDVEYAADAYRAAARVFHRRLIPIYLTCSTKEHQRRFECREREEVRDFDNAREHGIVFPKDLIEAMAPEKREKAYRALGNPDYYARELYTLSRPSNHANGRFTYTAPESNKEPAMPGEHHGLCIDTTGRTPREVAMVIRDFVHDVISGKAEATTKIWATTREERELLKEEEKKRKEEEKEKTRKERQQDEQLKRGQEGTAKRNSENSGNSENSEKSEKSEVNESSDWVVVNNQNWTAPN